MDSNRVEFIWLPFEEELVHLHALSESKTSSAHLQIKPLQNLKTFLARNLNVSIELSDIKQKVLFGSSNEKLDENNRKKPLFMFYSEYLFRVNFIIKANVFSSSDSISTDWYKKLIKLFCSEKQSKKPLNLWMNIDTSPFVFDPLRTLDYFIDLKCFSLGNIVKLNTFVEHFSSESSLNPHKYKITQVKIKVMHDEQMLHLYFVVGKSNVPVKDRNAETHRMHQLEIPYSAIHTILICVEEDMSVFFRLYKSPLLFAVRQTTFDELEHEIKNYVSYLDLEPTTAWIRTVKLFENCPPSIRKEFSMNNTLKLRFCKEDYNEVLKIMFHHKNVQIYFSPMTVIPYKHVQHPFQFKDENPDESTFDCYYASQCLLTQSYEILDHLTNQDELQNIRTFIKSIKNPKGYKALADAFCLIHAAVSQCNVILLSYSIKMLYERISSSESVYNMYEQGKKVVLVKRAVATPTHVCLLPPMPILQSRTLRECNPNYSIRISIRDVNFEIINFSFKASRDNRKELLKEFFNVYFKNVILVGIKVGKRTYHYVGSSTSQLRGHGLWLYAEDEKGKTAATIRKAIGNMDKIKQVPKFMARMGQTFSQALDCIEVPKEFTNIDKPDKDVTGGVKQFLKYDDIDNGKRKFLKEVTEEAENVIEEPYTFSDGIGRVSLEIAEEVYKKLHVEDKRPCAMQIRYAGCKGMLVVDPNLKGKRILFRESMKKFESSSESLEILKFSAKRAAFLNKPFITILEQLGVSKDVFIKLQKEMIQNHIRSMFHEADACKFLNRNSQLRFDFIGMHEVGICFTEDPLFRSMIYGLFRKQLELLKTKANIEIPSNKGRAMFGVLDETFTLEYGQVFVQYSDWYTDEPKIITGTVVVTKNPCMHPGDVRKFEAVDVPDLHHICDCIVFPAKGPRPHPDEMAGSDLDGDEYHVIWLSDLIFERSNEDAMNYAVSKEKAKSFEGPIQPADELDHLCEYIMHSNVGLIANAHLVFADKEKEGIFSEKCIRLAKKYSIALDFVKSGIPVDHTDFVLNYPDFQQKLGEKNTYISKKALGSLYRNCKRLEMGLEISNSEIEYRLDEDLLYENWQNYKKKAQNAYKRYCRKIEYMINLYSFDSEGELLAGAIINPPKYFEQRHDLDNLKAFLEHELSWMFLDLEKQFFIEFGGKPQSNCFSEQMLQKASAYYAVTYMPDDGAKNLYFGLPWAVSDILKHIKSKKYVHKGHRNFNTKSLLAQIIDNSLRPHMPKISETSDVSDIYENRLKILDVARHVLLRWLKTQRDMLGNPNVKAFETLIEKEFALVSDILLSCDEQYIKNLKRKNKVSQAISPCHYVIETLLSIANVKTKQRGLQQELGLLSWVTLVKLACSYNPQYLGIADKEGNYASRVFYIPLENAISIFKVHLFEDDVSNEFSLKMLHDPDSVISYLKEQFRLKAIDFRFDAERKKVFVAIFTVMGSRYSIEKLKDFIIQPDFYSWILKRETLFPV